MRRICYRYPQRVDLSFAMGMTFPETLKYIAELNGQESTKTTGKELVRVRVKVEIALNRAEFGDITPDTLRPGVITEAVDLRISVLALALRGTGKSRSQTTSFTYGSPTRTPALTSISQRKMPGKAWMLSI